MINSRFSKFRQSCDYIQIIHCRLDNIHYTLSR